jgi:Spy/CpxP family protein refolding chaperone
MKRILILTSLAVLVGALMLPAAFARGGHGPGGGHGFRGHRGPGFGPRLMKAIDATEEQTAAIKEARTRLRAASEPLHTQIKAKHDEMKALWQAEQLDRDALHANAASIGAIKQQLQALRIDFRADVLESLTLEQRTKLAEMRTNTEQRRAKRTGKRGKRGMRGDFGGEGGPGYCDGSGPCGGQGPYGEAE